ncbi:MAG: ferritin-like domain-containing protein [Betaproteobacteria bacterium]
MNRSVDEAERVAAGKVGDGEPHTLPELMALAFDMEREAAQRYAEFADAMEMHNNREVAGLFRKMAQVEQGHAQAILSEMGWSEAPAPAAWGPEMLEGPETPRLEDVHYLMWPYHALEVALACEERAERFYGRIAGAAEVESVRNAARALQDEEREHVSLIRAWMGRVEKPSEDWADDPDPPRYTD